MPRGRPRLPDHLRKRVYPLRLSPDQLAVLKQAAGPMPLRHWMVQTLMAVASRVNAL